MHAKLERLVADVRAAGAAGNWHAALALALALPDICGKAQRRNYRDWVDAYAIFEAKFLGDRFTVLGGHEVYALRNAFLHAGSDDLSTYTQKDQTAIRRMRLVQSSRVIRYTADRPGAGGTLEIPVGKLCEQILCGVEKWAEATQGDAAVQTNLDSLLIIHAEPILQPPPRSRPQSRARPRPPK